MSNLSIEKGKILIYRVFDIGEEINLSKLENLIQEKSERFKLNRDSKKAIIISDAPLGVSLGEEKIEIASQSYSFDVSAKVWTYGTLSITLQFSIPSSFSWSQLVELSQIFENASSIDQFAKNKAREFTQTATPAMKKTNEWDTYEDYVIYFVEKINGIENLKELKDSADIPALILAEPKEDLSDNIKKNVHEMTFQYSKNDMAVVDWNSALVIEPSGSMDLPDVIEFALTQLLEMRFYDDLLDQKLATLYSSIENKSSGILNDPYSKLAKEAGQTYIELSEIIETIENSFKVVGDFYLATIFRAASSRFRFNDWLNNINSKLGNLAEVSKVLQGEIHARRAQASEIIIIVLIAFELLPALFKLFSTKP
jgi:ribosomal protein L18E